MTTIWVIEDGACSDYRVVGVFSSKQNAELVRAKVGGDIAEWPLDPCVAELSQGYKCFHGEMLHDGTVERMEEKEISGYNLETGLSIWPRSTAPYYAVKNVQSYLYGTVLAKDVKHAVKIFNEKRAQLIALGEWT